MGKPFESYRDGLPPGPGVFATAGSIDSRGTPIRIGDIVTNADFDARGVVLAIGGDLLLYLLDEPDANGALNVFLAEPCRDCLVIGHVYDVLREVARIEALALSKTEKDVADDQKRR